MAIRVKKRNLIIFSLSIIFLLAIIPFVIAAAYKGAVSGVFIVQLAITNVAPIIKLNNISTFSVDPVTGSNTIILISFNVTDANGISNINATKVVVNLTLGYDEGQWRSNGSDDDATSEFGTCKNGTEPGPGTELSRIMVNCTVIMKYYDNQSANWKINVSIKDISGGVGVNGSPFSITYNELSAISLPHIFVNFSSVSLGQSNVRAYPHLILNNTGNDDFTELNMSAGNLIGTTLTSESIGVGQFGVNLTNSSTNLRLSFPSSGGDTGKIQLRDPDTGGNATLRHGNVNALTDYNDNIISDKGNLSVFFWVNVPSSGVSSQLYNASWNITITDRTNP